MSVDLHFHLLPGIDDGPASMEEAVALARAAAELGTSTIVATPHVSWHYPNDARTIRRAAESLRRRLRELDVDVEVAWGAEIAMTRIGAIEEAELAELALGDGPWLLVEPPFTSASTGLEAIVARLHLAGHRVLLAHPERCSAFRRDRAALEALVGEGVLTSLTAGSLVGDFGEEVRAFSLALVRDGLAHNLASDAHDLASRPPGILGGPQSTGIEPLARWMTEEVPRAILSGDELPPRPAQLPPSAAETATPGSRGPGRFRRAS